MRAVQFSEYGDPTVLRLVDLPVPTPGPGQVRIRVAATAFNPLDAGLRGGWVRDAFPLPLPYTPGYDLSGVVDALGDKVDGVAVGDAVIAFVPMIAGGGAAEYAVVAAEDLVGAPHGVPLADAASLPSTATTAWQALRAADLTAGQRVLVNGAGGAVGGFAVQLAHQRGAEVIAVTRPETAAKVRRFGADQVVEHGAVMDTEPVDVLLTLGRVDEDELARLTSLVRDGGVVVNTVPATPTPGDEARGVRGIAFFVRPDPQDLATLAALVSDGRLVLDVAEHVDLQDLPDVHDRSDRGDLPGKVVVEPGSQR